jgi:uncharacterized protein YbjT (DUF2867 family)
MRIAVAGGTGTVGRHVVAALDERGHRPVVLARSRGVDVLTGAGLDAALAGVEAVVDVTNMSSMRPGKAIAFFSDVADTLLNAERRAGVGHHVVVSIVGIDEVHNAYYDAKRRQEELVLGGPVPASVLRATQFHEFVPQTLAMTKRGPLAVTAVMRLQPVAAREVGAALASLAVGPPVGRASDLGGPEEHQLPDLVRRMLAARGQRALVVPLRLPGAAGRAMARGGLLPGPDANRGTITFDQWLATPDARLR